MKLHTMGHACMVLEGAAGQPLLASDPWLEGSCYWRSWWLQNPPTDAQIGTVAAAPFLYITHEHPDHLHLPSLRRLGKQATILLPDFHRMKMDQHLRDEGWTVRRLPAGRWETLAPGVSVMSVPQWNNDSVLLVDTPKALIANLNDAKPLAGLFDEIARLRRRLGKPLVVLRSHSPAGPFFNYFRDGERTPNLTKRAYVSKANAVCDQLEAEVFVPFASQVVLRRTDSVWANDFKVTHADLAAGWRSRTRLGEPFSTVDLDTLECHSAVDPAMTGPFTDRQKTRVAEEEGRSVEEALGPEDLHRLRRCLNRQRSALAVLFPQGFAVASGGQRYLYTPVSGRLRERSEGGAFTIEVPAAPLRDALNFGHFGDLCITMFVPIHLHGNTQASRVDVMWMLMILADYGYAGGPLNRLSWAWWAWRTERWRDLPLPETA